jgi:periplasmic protein TonB
MFDKLIESEPEGADFRSRRSYFMVSSLVVGVFFATAVVLSLYAAEVSLGSDDFVLSTMLAPVEPPSAPEIEQPRQERTTIASNSPVPVRQINMARVEESRFVPDSTSVIPNKHLARPATDRFKIDPQGVDSGPSQYSGPARGVSGGPFGPTSGGLVRDSTSKAEARDPEPPPAVKRPSARPEPPRSLGVVNGRASHLPKPAYPAAAIALNVQGKVDVQVLIDESGNVVSAKAINGHPLLKDAAERSARNARFSPTLLSNVPVKVTGVIVFNFIR